VFQSPERVVDEDYSSSGSNMRKRHVRHTERIAGKNFAVHRCSTIVFCTLRHAPRRRTDGEREEKAKYKRSLVCHITMYTNNESENHGQRKDV